MKETTPAESATKSLLTQEEKNFLDDLPDKVVAYIFLAPSDGIQVTHVAKDLSGVTKMEFHGERAIAARAYLTMLMEYGIRKDMRLG